MRKSIFAVCLVFISAIVFALVISYAIPPNESSYDQSMEYVEKHHNTSSIYEYHYSYWDDYNYVITSNVMYLDISENDFKKSMTQDVMRQPLRFKFSMIDLVNPNDPYVVAIADRLNEETAGKSEYIKATAGLGFVNWAIEYYNDYPLYGCTERWATPLETLYMHRGDCEDTSILLCSIYLAMGLDAVLLDFPTHVAVGVNVHQNVSGGKGIEHNGSTYWFCETTAKTIDVGEGVDDALLDTLDGVYAYGEQNGIATFLSNSIAGYRNLFYKWTGI